jgi:hypothetical protein
MVITGAILRVLWTSLSASVIITVVFALAVFGLVRWSDLRAAGRSLAAAGYVLLATIALAGFTGAVVYGLILVTQKS